MDEHRIHQDPMTFTEEELTQEVEEKLHQIEEDVEKQKQILSDLENEEQSLISEMKSQDIDDPLVQEIAAEVEKELEKEEQEYIKEKEEELMSNNTHWDEEVEKQPLVEQKVEEPVSVAAKQEVPKAMPAFYKREK